MVEKLKRFLSSAWGPVITGAAVGILAPLLVKLGNPGNMGVCVVCFARDTMGALGFHRAAPVQYIRPELIGLVLGSLAAALLFREYRARTGSAPILRFVLGMVAAIGGLVFLGCPWRAFLRLGGGDWNAAVGILGLAAGAYLGTLFLRRGFSLGRSQNAHPLAGLMLPALMVGLLALLAAGLQFGRDADGNPVGPVFSSTQGPGSQHAPLLIALAVGLLIGFLAQRSRFCTVGGLRDLFLMKDWTLFNGVLALTGAAFLTNLALGFFKPGFLGQPLAHTDGVWNFLGMLLAGLAYVLGGGCPGRQLVLSGEGDADSAVFVMGVLAGVALAHNFNLASSAKGVAPYGPVATLIGIGVCLGMGLLVRERKA